MGTRVGAALAAVTILAGACQADEPARPDGSATVTSPAGEETGPAFSRSDCRATTSASVRGVTGTFASPEEAAASVVELPPDGSLVAIARDGDVATFGWVTGRGLEYVIDTHRDAGGWIVGSYEVCAIPEG